jgi:hypothetical protein
MEKTMKKTVIACALAALTVNGCAVAPQDEAASESEDTQQAEQHLNGSTISVEASYVPLGGAPCNGYIQALGGQMAVDAYYKYDLYKNGVQIDSRAGDVTGCVGEGCPQPWAYFPVNSPGFYSVKLKATYKWAFFNVNDTGESSLIQLGGTTWDCPAPPVPRFAWSSAGPIPFMQCVNVNEGADPHTWADNYFCSDRNDGLRFSGAGPISGLTCVSVNEPGDPHTWNDNYLCNSAGVNFQWSYDGPIPGRRCVQWTESADPDGWDDNYLCY